MTASSLSRETSVASDAPPTDMLLASTNQTLPGSSSAPVGAGIVFGGAATVAATAKPIKKRTRTAKIGVAATAAATDTVPPAKAAPSMNAAGTMSKVELGEYSASSGPDHNNNDNNNNNSTLDAAAEAARRAEEFISQKMKQQQQQQLTSAATVTRRGSGESVDETKSLDEEDEIVQKALAAAEEAQQQMAKQRSFSDRMGIGKLFGARTSPPTSTATLSQHGISTASSLPTAPNMERSTSSGSNVNHSSSSSSRPPLPRRDDDSHDATPRQPPENTKRTSSDRSLNTQQQQQQQHHHHHHHESSMKAKSAFEPPAPLEVPTYGSTSKSSSLTMLPLKVMSPKVAEGKTEAQQPMEKSPTEEFEDMLKQFRETVALSMAEVTRLRQHRSGLLEERFLTSAKERLATQQKAQAEAQLQAAAEAEDFELADRMGSLMDAHERERLEFAAILDNIGRALKQLDLQKKELVEGVSKCFSDIQEKLKAFLDEQQSKDTKDNGEAMKTFAAVSKQLSTENDRLQHDWKHLQRDADLVAEERKELEAAISEQSGEYKKMRDDAKARLSKVEEEIEELRKKLNAKQKEAAELRTEAAGHDEMILKIRVKFSRQLTRIQQKEADIKDNTNEWELEKKSYETHKEAHEAKVKAHSEALLARDKLLESLTTEVEMASKFEEIVSKEICFGITSNETDGVDQDLAQMQANVVKCEAAVSEAKEVLNASNAALSSLEEEVKSLEMRIPVLEDIKKAAATRRDFKAAGKASKEIKEASTRLKECQEDLLDEAKEKVTAAKEQLQKVTIELEEKRKVADDQERETSIAAMRRLADNIKRLMATKASVCGEYKENSVKAAGAYVLDSQILSLKAEGQTFGHKYGMWDDLMAEIGADKDNACSMPETTTSAAEKVPTVESSETVEESDVGAEVVETEKPAEDAKTKAEKLQTFRDLTKQLKEIEASLERAAAEEKYDEAAELDEALQMLVSETAALGLTEEEMTEALADSSESEDAGETDKPDGDEKKSEDEDEDQTAEQVGENDEAADPVNGDAGGDDEDDSNKVKEDSDPSQQNGEANESGDMEDEKIGSAERQSEDIITDDDL